MDVKEIVVKMRRLKSESEFYEKEYLRYHGWTETCDTPGCLWLWVRDFADIDQQRQDTHEQLKARMYNPTPPKPYGVVMVNKEVAMQITRAALEEPADQDDEGC